MPKTDAELKQLAIDMYHGHAFTDRSLPKGDAGLFGMVFMVAGLGGLNETLSLPENERPHLIYEYINKALDRSINGYPIFASLHYLTKDEVARLAPYFEEYKNLQDGFLKSEDKNE